MFHIRCISIPKCLYFNFFSASFCTSFLSAGISTSISVNVFSFSFLMIISGLIQIATIIMFLVYSVCFIYLIMFKKVYQVLSSGRDLVPHSQFDDCTVFFSSILNSAWSDDGLNKAKTSNHFKLLMKY